MATAIDNRNVRWTVKLAWVYEDQRPGEKPTALPSFDVEGGHNTDTAKAAARAYMAGQGYKVRSLGVCTPVESHTLSAVISRPRPEATPATVTTLAKPVDTPTIHKPRGAVLPASSTRVAPKPPPAPAPALPAKPGMVKR